MTQKTQGSGKGMLFCLKSGSSCAKFIYLSLCSGWRWPIAQIPQVNAPLCKWDFRILCETWTGLKSHQLFHKEACFCYYGTWGRFWSASMVQTISCLCITKVWVSVHRKDEAVVSLQVVIGRCQCDGFRERQLKIKKRLRVSRKKILISSADKSRTNRSSSENPHEHFSVWEESGWTIESKWREM